MKNNQKNNMEYINELENENLLLREENKRLRKIFLSDCESYNTSLIRLRMQFDALKKENEKLKQHNSMLALMSY